MLSLAKKTTHREGETVVVVTELQDQLLNVSTHTHSSESGVIVTYSNVYHRSTARELANMLIEVLDKTEETS